MATTKATTLAHGQAGSIVSGTLADARIPSLAASKITSGTFATARIADDAINLDKLAHLGTDGHVLTSTGTGSAPAFEAVPSNMPTDSILQAKYSWYGGTDTVALATNAGNKSTGPVYPTTIDDSLLKISLTPQYQGSKVIICANVMYGVSEAEWAGPCIRRSEGGDDIVLSTSDIAGSPSTAFIHSLYNNVATSGVLSTSLCWQDTTISTNAHLYEVVFGTYDSSGMTVNWNRRWSSGDVFGLSTMTVMEVKQ
tara:strand:- start:324 stop:1085 length:762 start_codon:yes stop_codon:yes gene_type:complete